MRPYHVMTTVALVLVFAGGVQAQGRGRRENNQQGQEKAQQKGRQRAQEHAQPVAPASVELQRRAGEERARLEQYRTRLNQQTAADQARAAALQQQQRNRQYQAEQQYLQRLRMQQAQLQARRIENERGIYAPYAYRYRRAGHDYQVSQYGADLLRQAVRNGYQEGYRAGAADRMDRQRFDFQDTFAYQDAEYGYTGLYVPQADYNYYFRQGFQRGYEDGFYQRQQYGLISGGAPSILANVLGSVLALIPIH